MSLATRCTACGTTFRVVQDQLRVSEGWVRCGRCDTVFDAVSNLIDLDTPATVEPPAPVRTPRAEAPPPAVVESAPIDIHRLLSREDQQAPAGPALHDGNNLVDEPDDALAAPAAVAARQTDPPDPVAAPPARAVAADVPAPSRAAEALAATPMPPPMARPAAVPAVAPTFLREAEREARWNSPAMRAALAGSSLILSIMLVMQVVHHERDAIASWSPTAASWLRSACARWNCSIEPVRRIGDLSIETSALSKVPGQPQSVRLTLSLHNRADIDLALPAVELNLTDAQGKLIARKALMPQDFRIDPPVVGAASARPLQLVLSTTGDARVAGYTVELFYP